MPKTTHAKVLIIGSGPAGYTAAIYAARAMLDPILIQGIQPGGQLTITTDVENYPGFADVIQGPWLMEQMQKQAAHVGPKLVTDHVVKADLSRAPVSDRVRFRRHLPCRCPHSATGAQARWLDLPSEQSSRALACRPAPPATASSIAARMSSSSAAAIPRSRRRCSSPISRRMSPSCTGATSFRAEKILQDRLFKHPKIARRCGTPCSRRCWATGTPLKVTGVRLRDLKTGAVRERAVDGVFIAIGHTPASELFAGPAGDEAFRLHRDGAAFDRDLGGRASLRPATSPTTSIVRP